MDNEQATHEAQYTVSQYLKGPVMCETCAVMIVLRGYESDDVNKRQMAATMYTYDLRNITDDEYPWAPQVQPLTNIQMRFKYLLERRSQSERDPWRFMQSPDDDFEYLMKEMVDGSHSEENGQAN